MVPFAECYLDMETGCGVERRGWEVGGSLHLMAAATAAWGTGPV